MQRLRITSRRKSSTGYQPVEIVERKGLGHPDTICDALAEELSRALSRYYLERFGLVMHHNVDKALLWGGISKTRFGGGEVLAPIEIFLAGRATCEYKGVRVPVEELVRESCTGWLAAHFHVLDPAQHIKLHSLIRPGSSDLVELYLRQEKTGAALANDTSCGVGYAPLSRLEQAVLRVEKHLNSAAIKQRHPAIGEDIKVMGVRQDDSLDLTIACAFIDRYIRDIDDYVGNKAQLIDLVKQVVSIEAGGTVSVTVNAADDIGGGSLYLTVTGTSAESGDDGEVGRGNRVNGLITPYRPMNMEAAAGKNPVTHVGKLYNIAAQQIAGSLVEQLDVVLEAGCYLVSRIGSPIHEPQVVDLALVLQDDALTDKEKTRINDIVHDRLGNIYTLRRKIIAGEISVY